MAIRHSIVGITILNGTIYRSNFCPMPLRVSNLSGCARMKNKYSKLYCGAAKDGEGVIASSEQSVKRRPESVAGAEKVSAVLFDMDGVLCNSEEASRQAAVELFAEMGIEVATEDFIPFMGTGEENFLGGVAQVKSVKDFDPVAAKKRFFEIYLEKYARPNSGLGYPGSLDLILQCKNEGLKVAVASSADRIKVNANLAASGLHQSNFDAIVSADLFENLKPAPDIFLAAAKALNVPPNECVVVEDALAGVQAANAAKMRCIAVTTTLSEEKLLQAGPSLIRKDIGNIAVSDILNSRRSDEKSDQVVGQLEIEQEAYLEVYQRRTSAGHIPDIQSVLSAEILFPGGLHASRRDILKLGTLGVAISCSLVAVTHWKAMSYTSPKALWNVLLGLGQRLVARDDEMSQSTRIQQFKNYISDLETRGSGQQVPEFPPKLDWLNASPLRLRQDLRGKVVVLDFWTYCCINCMHVLPDLEYLEKKYKGKPFTVVGVHSAKFDNEKDLDAIRYAVLRYEITHPVVNDGDMFLWRELGVNSWPTFVVVSPNGKLLAQLAGEGHRQDLDDFVEAALQFYGEKQLLDNHPIPEALEKDKDTRLLASPLKFPGKLATDLTNHRLFTSDSNNHRIVVTDLEGNFIMQVGGSGEVLRDGTFEYATFNRPQGLAYNPKKNVLYVADTENHALREINFVNETVQTLAGNGEKGSDYKGGRKGMAQVLNSPWDVCIDSSSEIVYIAMAGQHQIWQHDIVDGVTRAFSGDGYERNLNGQRFSDAFRFLIKLPEEIHIWCNYHEVMWPLLEPFGSFFQYKQADMPLKVLWKRICAELRCCCQCCVQHHKAQELYKSEFEEEVVKPLLSVLQTLDEERVAEHLRDINSREKLPGPYANEEFAEILSILFEVLMFPDLLDDQAIANEFVPFLLEVEKSHEITLMEKQQYVGVYALLFLQNTETRAIGFRLAGILEDISNTSHLEPVQPLVKKFIDFLNNSPPNKKISRPRIQYDRESVWLGIKSLIGFLSPSVFEEGIIERYPIFLSIVLNHVSDDSAKDFAHAVDILKMLFKILGCKLWLKTTFSPSVMRNTLLGQCFHTRIERHHKAIFDLFEPFLQSLEALQDGEYERQRRHFLYFLLHQVSHSSNFSALMKKKACQIAMFIVGRGYKMVPPCPPFECAHMWGPSLIRSVRDPSLYTSLRQPAFDLIQTIIVADAAALTSLWSRQCNRHILFAKLPHVIDEDDDESQPMSEIEEADRNCWTEFNMLSKLTSKDCVEWFCIPLLWVEALTKSVPSSLPLSFTNSVMWALSRLSTMEPDISNLVKMPVLEWISVHFAKYNAAFTWDIPKGCDDGADAKGCINSINAAPHCVNLLRLIRRCAAYYARQIEESELRMQWTWEPRMCETIILLFVDPHDVVRTAGKVILEQVSNTRGVVSGLQFLCSSQASVSAMSLGLRYAIKMLLGNSISSTSQILQHLFFIVSKLLDSSMIMIGDSSNERNVMAMEKFCQLLSENIWPLLSKCLTEGKCLVQDKAYQITFVRLLEILPLIVKHMSSSLFKRSSFCGVKGDSSVTTSKTVDIQWFQDLIDWGNSQLMVIQSYWKKAVGGILNIFKDLTYGPSDTVIHTIKAILESDKLVVYQLQEQVSLLSILKPEYNASQSQRDRERRTVHNQALVSGEGNHFHKAQDTVYGDSCEKGGVTELSKGKIEPEIIILSDDEIETERGNRAPSQSHAHAKGGFQKSISLEIEKTIQADEKSNDSLSNQKSYSNSTDSFPLVTSSSKICPVDTNPGSSNSGIKEPSFTCEQFDSRGSIFPQPGNPISNVSVTSVHPTVTKYNSSPFPTVSDEKHVSSWKVQENIKELSKSKILNRTGDATNFGTGLESHGIGHQKHDAENIAGKSNVHKPSTVCSSSDDFLLKEIVSGSKDDPLEAALDAARNMPPLLPKPPAPPKRQLIQLQMPVENNNGRFDRLQGGMKTYKPPRLDDWYKRILELNYFSIVGISLPGSETEDLQAINLTEVPISFRSPDHYVDVFRPLVLEEFKAQLKHSFEEVSSPEDMCFGNLHLLSLEKIDDFHLGRFMPDSGGDAVARGFSENDLVLLSLEPFQTVSDNVHMIGKVERRERDAKSRLTILVLRLYFQSGILRLTKARRHLTVRSKWCVTRLMSITPQLREFQALSAVKDTPLLPVILNPHRAATAFADVCDRTQGGDMKLFPKPLKECLKEAFNESQFKAINAVIERNDSQKNCELSLIQGPPGTGKTSTILAIVSVLLAISKISNKSSGGNTRDNVYTQQVATSSLSRGKFKMSQATATARLWQDAGHARQLMKCNNKSACKPFEVEGPRTSRVLVCAQSNAAVDELVSRICKDGLHDITGKKYKPYIVRVGNAKTIHPDSLPVFIDTLVEQRLGEKKQIEADSRDERAHNITAKLRSDLEKLVESIQFHEAQRSNRQDEGTNKFSTEDDTQLKFLYKRKRAIFTELAAAEAEEKKAFEDNWALKRALRRDIIREAEIVVTTLSGSGGDIYSACIELFSQNKHVKSVENALFDAVVIDEAAQALEPATLIPMQLLKSTGSKCVMVGDPKQLPATVLSQLASKFSYECSMFERLQHAGYPVAMLSTQYRMHPEICKFPSAHFYDNQLRDGVPMKTKRTALFHENYFLGPYVFYDVVDGREESGRSIRSQSLCNESEVDVALEILKFLNLRYPQEFQPERIGIITPYKQQLKELRLQVTKEFGPSIAGKMEFNTVDGFQGREVDMLIFSTVRASSEAKELSTSESGGIGFVSDVRRMNVSLTRAKFSLWIVGNARTLQRSPHWAALLKNVKERKLLFTAKKPYRHLFPNALLGFSAKSCLSTASSANQASPKHSPGHQEGKRFKRDNGNKMEESSLLGPKRNMEANSLNSACQASPKHSPGHQEGKRFKRDNGNKMEESSLLGPKRNMEVNSLNSLYAKQDNRKMHTEERLQNDLGIEVKMSDDALKERKKTHGGKPYKPEGHSASRTSNDKSHLNVENDEHQNKLAINKSGLVGKVKTITNIHCLPEEKNKASIAQKPKPKVDGISKGRSRAIPKREHQMDKDKHQTKDVHIDTDPNQLNASNIASQQANTVMTPREETLQPKKIARIPGDSTGEPHGQNEVNSGENIHKSSKDDLIAFRKRQREAVNSILPSGALISSKKTNVSRTSTRGRYTGSVNDGRNGVGNLPIQGSSDSIGRLSEKSAAKIKQKSQITRDQKEPSPQRDISDAEGRLFEEWERFEKKLAESKAARHPTRD